MTPPDSELIARVLTCDDHAAFGTLVGRHQSAVRRFLRHLVGGDDALADDLAQETFLESYRSLHRFRAEAAFSTWLLGIAHNHWRNARRRRAFVALPDEQVGPIVESETQTTDLRHDLAVALRELSEDERLAIHLAYQQGLTHEEIAALVDWPLGTVKTHLARGKAQLRQHLAVWNPQT